ncbi:MAG: type VI-A CRISPR-associated RNA-guided ribonuclease Cas13a [Bacilli bacterium]|nr:type VI-A CRISPR-associated RNA-guided ribonuclease Cas13a [Bacilli bacterium]
MYLKSKVKKETIKNYRTEEKGTFKSEEIDKLELLMSRLEEDYISDNVLNKGNKNTKIKDLLKNIIQNLLSDNMKQNKTLIINLKSEVKQQNKKDHKNGINSIQYYLNKKFKETNRDKVDLLNHYIFDGDEKASTQFKEEMNIKKDKKLKYIKKSIENNKIRYVISGNKIKPVSKRDQWFLAMINRLLKNEKLIDIIDNYKNKLLNYIVTIKEELIKLENSLKDPAKTKSQLDSIYKQMKIKETETTDSDLYYYVRELNAYVKGLLKAVKTNQKNGKRKGKSNDKIGKSILNVETILYFKIKNKIVSMIIDMGKTLIYSKNETNITSDVLENNKIKDDYKNDFIKLIVYGTKKLATLINYNIDHDLLFSRNLHITSNHISNFNDYFKDKDALFSECSEILDLKGYMRELRNKIYHYTDLSYDRVLASNLSSDIYKKIYENDQKNLKDKMIEKFKSAMVLSYFDSNSVNKILEKCTYDFTYQTYQFVPSFNKIYKRIIKLDRNQEEENSASRFLKRQLYQYSFLTLTSRDTYLKAAIEELKKKIEKDTFKEILVQTPYIKEEEFLNEIQSKIYLSHIDNTDLYSNFMIDLYWKAFCLYLKDLKLEFNSMERIEISLEEYKELKIVIKENSIFYNSIYIIFKLVPPNILSDFINSTVKYQQFVKKQKGNVNKLQEILYLGRVALLSHQTLIDQEQKEYERIIDAIFDDEELKRLKPFYYNNNEIKYNGNLSYILERDHVIIQELYIDSNLYKKKIKEEYNKKENKQIFEDILENKDYIVKLQDKRKDLHERILKNKNLKFKNNINNILSDDIKNYKEVVNKIDNYHKIYHLLNFNYLRKILVFYNAFQSKQLEYVNGLERDYLYFFTFFEDEIEIDKITSGKVSNMLDYFSYEENKGNINEKLRELSKSKIKKQILDQIFSLYTYENPNIASKYKSLKKGELTGYRNLVSHLNYKLNAKDPILKIGESANMLRDILKYNRSKSNSVVKSLENLFQEDGIILNGILEHGYINFEIKQGKSVEHLKFLKKGSFNTSQNSEIYIELLRKII